jgi:hypothetical protein
LNLEDSEKASLLKLEITDPLPKEEIEIARLRIDELHPLKDVSIGQLFPILSTCFKGRSKEEVAKSLMEDDDDIEEVDQRLTEIIENAQG